MPGGMFERGRFVGFWTTLNGRGAVLMRFSLKAEIVVALLTRERALPISFRRADYPLLC